MQFFLSNNWICPKIGSAAHFSSRVTGRNVPIILILASQPYYQRFIFYCQFFQKNFSYFLTEILLVQLVNWIHSKTVISDILYNTFNFLAIWEIQTINLKLFYIYIRQIKSCPFLFIFNPSVYIKVSFNSICKKVICLILYWRMLPAMNGYILQNIFP